MNKSAFFLLFVLLSTTISYAQSNFRAGYIITNENDTIRGFIDFKSNKSNTTSCRFKAGDERESKVYYPFQIAGYQLTEEGKYYVSREVELDGLSKKVFLEFLVKGIADLYFYKHKSTDMYFIDNGDQKMIPVIKEDDIVDGSVKIENNRYKKTVYEALGKDGKMMEAIKELKYSRPSLIEVVKTYHKQTCTTGEECIEFENNYKKDFAKFEFIVYGGVRFNRYKWNRLHADATDMLSPEIGAQVMFTNPRFSRSLALTLDVSFSNIKSNTTYKYEYREVKSKFSALTATWKVGAQYIYPRGRFRPTIGAGFGIHYLLNKSKSIYQTLTQIEEKDVPPNAFNGFSANAGIDIMVSDKQAIVIRLAYDHITEYNDDYNAERDKMNIVQVKVGYKF